MHTIEDQNHVHDWRLMRKSDISTRHANAPPTRESLIDLVLDDGSSSEHWTCPDCGEDRYKYRPGLMQLLMQPNKAPKEDQEER